MIVSNKSIGIVELELTALDRAPFCKVSRHNLFDIVCNMNPSNIHCSVLPHKTSDTTHVVSVIGKLVASKAVDIGVEVIVWSR